MKFASNRSVASVQPCLGVVHDGRPRDNIANAVRGHAKQFDVDGHLCDGKAAFNALTSNLRTTPSFMATMSTSPCAETFRKTS